MNQSYPSPNAGTADGAASGGPFYPSSSNPQQPGQQQSGLSNPDELQLTAQLSRNLAPMMSGGSGGAMAEGEDPRNQVQGMISHQYAQDQMQTTQGSHMPSGHSPMEHMGGQYASPDGSMAPRKRSKVSRACDECRRKKIRCDATGEPGDDQCSSCKRVGARCEFSRVPMKRGPSKGYIKELADRVNVLEGVVQQAGDPVPPYLPRRESPPQPRRASDEYSPPPGAESVSRKRAHSTQSGDFGTPYLPQRVQNAWTPQDSQRQLPHLSPSFASAQSTPSVPQAFKDPNYSPNGLQPTPQWRVAPGPSRRPSNSYENYAQEASRMEQPSELDDSILEGYYKMIHATYPLLSNSKERLVARLTGCSELLRNAFYEALQAAVRSFSLPNGSQFQLPENIRGVAHMIVESQFEVASSRSLATNMIYLQTMLLLAIHAGNQPSGPRNQGGPSRSLWLGSAVGLAYSMKLHLHNQPEKGVENDSDSDEKLARRIWWTLVIMDRWHASSTSSPLLIPDESVVVYPEDQIVLGEYVYHLARLSIILGHSAMIMLAPSDLPPLSVVSGPVYGVVLRGELERFRESLPTSFLQQSIAPLIHLCYWHVRILVELTLAESEPSDLLTAAKSMIDILKQNPGYVTPITYHCTLLATLALIELVDYESTRAEADNLLKFLLDSPLAPSTWDTVMRAFISNTKPRAIPTASISSSKTIADSKHALTASQGLQHLADLATAAEGDASVVREVEKGSSGPAGAKFQRYHHLRETVKNGYLSVFSGESGR